MKNKYPLVYLSAGLSVFLSGSALSDLIGVVEIPDTQMLVEEHPEVFFAQMDWIVNNKDTRNIAYVAHLGDLKDDLKCDNKPVTNPETGAASNEWEIVDFGFAKLDRAGIAYGAIPGNHDYEPRGSGTNTQCITGDPTDLAERDLTTYDSLFGPNAIRGVSRMDKKPWFGDFSMNEPGNRIANSNDDNFTLFGQCGVDFIAINFGYRSDNYLDNGGCNVNDPLRAPGCSLIASGSALTNTEIHWADRLLAQYPNRLAILTSHYMVQSNWIRSSNTMKPVIDRNQFSDYGAQLFDFLGHHPNLFMMVGGHDWGESWRTEVRGGGLQPVQAMLSDYQMYNYPSGTSPNFAQLSIESFGDSGFMRVMTFDTDSRVVTIDTFVPTTLGRNGSDIVSTFRPQQTAGGADQVGLNVGVQMTQRTASSGLKFSFANYGTTASTINCATVKSQPLQIDNGAIDVSGFDSATISISSVGTSADFNSSYGYYLTDSSGNPSSGQIIYANVKSASPGAVQVDMSAVTGSSLLGFFIIPNGASFNPGLTNGTAVSFTQVAGNWIPQVNGSPLSGSGAAAFYSTASLNSAGIDYVQESQTSQNWEDLVGGGDGDFNDVVIGIANMVGNSF